jgi:hypothetical protein
VDLIGRSTDYNIIRGYLGKGKVILDIYLSRERDAVV